MFNVKSYKGVIYEEKKVAGAKLRLFRKNSIVVDVDISIDMIKYIMLMSRIKSNFKGTILFTIHGSEDKVVKALKKFLGIDIDLSSDDIVFYADGVKVSLERLLKDFFSNHAFVVIRYEGGVLIVGVKRR